MHTCPMHPEIKRDKKGRCPKCGMQLVEENSNKTTSHVPENDQKDSYKPLIVIIGLIFLVSFAIATKNPNNFVFSFISYYMSGFFIVFSAFKLMDLRGFAQGYSTYDLLAKKWYGYGYIYPFIELFFGLSMILDIYPLTILWLEVIVMSFSGLGVAIKIAKKENFRCSCLGTFLKVPLTKVTLVEDFGMSFLALILLIFGN